MSIRSLTATLTLSAMALAGLATAQGAPKPPDHRAIYHPQPTLADPMHEVTLFLPSGTAPANGWPVILFSNAGSFLRPPNGIGGFGPLEVLSATPFLEDAIQRGWAVVSMGSVGLLSAGGNIFRPFDDLAWDDDTVFWGEKDATWARQWVASNANAWGLDNDMVVPWGVSTGAIYGAATALSPRRTFTSGIPQSQQDTRCAALVAIQMPGWWPAYRDDGNGKHFLSTVAPGQAATFLSQSNPAHRRAASVSTWIRQAGSYAVDTPTFLYFVEPEASNDLNRDAQGDPTLTDTICFHLSPCPLNLHATWFGYTLAEDLRGVNPTLHDQKTLFAFDENSGIPASALSHADLVDLVVSPTQGALCLGTRTPEQLALEWLDWVLRSNVTPTVTPFHGNPPNPNGFQSAVGPKVGATWESTVDKAFAPNAVFAALFGSTALLTTPICVNAGCLLVDTDQLAFYELFTIDGLSGNVTLQHEVVADPCLLDATFYAQTILIEPGPNAVALNGLKITVGS